MTGPDLTEQNTHPAPPPGMPRWVKVSMVVVAILIAVAIAVVLLNPGGNHSPGRHGPMHHGFAPSAAIAL